MKGMEEGRGERGRGRKREWIAIELKRKEKKNEKDGKRINGAQQKENKS